MITLIRKNQKTLLIIITVLVIVAFAFLYNSTDMDKLGANNIGSIYGQTLSQTDIDRRGRLFNLASALGFREMLGTMAGQARSRDEAVMSFIFNSFVLEHESERLQLRPTETEIAAVIRERPVFQTNGVFDLQRYNQFLERTLSPNGLTETQLEEVIRAKLQLDRLQTLLGTSAVANPQEIRNEWERFNTLYDCSILRFDLASFTQGITIGDQEIADYFEANKASLMTDEQRTVKVVSYLLTAEQQELTGPERIQAMQQLADQAGEFAVAVLDADFDEVVAAKQLETQQYGPFSRVDTPEEFAAIPQFGSTAFAITETAPNSDPLQSPDGFILLHLTDIIPSREKTLAEAREEIIETITAQQAREQMAEAASETLTNVRAAMADGSSFQEAAATAGFETEQLPQFSLSNPQLEVEEARLIFQLISGLQAGETSDFTAFGDGGFLLHIDATTLPEDGSFEEEKARIAESLVAQKQQITLIQWFNSRLEAANLEGS